MKKLVINVCYGGFGLSPKASLWLWEKGFRGEGFSTPVTEYYKSERDPDSVFGLKRNLDKWREFQKYPAGKRDSLFLTVFTPDEQTVLHARNIKRDEPLLIECVEVLGEEASGVCAKLKVVEIPSDVEYEIAEYDGNESIQETHRSWS